MNPIELLATSLNRRDEIPNIELAERIVATNNAKAIQELVDHLNHKKLQNDCIKVLYEIGERAPSLIAEHASVFLDLLSHKNNRLQWGGMTALSAITTEKAAFVREHLDTIMAAADGGSVITRDQAVNILIKLCGMKAYAEKAFQLLETQLLNCPTNQMPMYAERALPIVDDAHREVFVNTLEARLGDFEKESKLKRVEKVIQKLRRPKK
ncbi:MAG TPA: hypothetical protein PKW08_13315 [Flavobacteriaceae bacterium]|nr:hypothetical protein [Flavobacteriaceae bacterium]MCB9213740.1 hypothetical protein [Alteromonas sp.]HPF12542.1 hypothetical protein [Flavobacteriaceae bacterium]HQU22561.1 hypothetical protein [Flavobacteriaceae bacterium]HQU66351.1 hypothetical protein [Flavobacteriaceae bacterium]